MTCKDCICFNRCEAFYLNDCAELLDTDIESIDKNKVTISECSTCEHFKDRSKFVELPCRVGSKVYSFEYQHISDCKKCEGCTYYDPYEICSCYSPNRHGLLCPPKCIQISSIVADFDYIIRNFRDFSKTVFLTKEAAEKALEERNVNK